MYGDGFNIIGSEFLGNNLTAGQIINGIQHEDIQTPSFDNSTLDLVVSNDVMEHVPSPSAAFGELARVMRPGARSFNDLSLLCSQPILGCSRRSHQRRDRIPLRPSLSWKSDRLRRLPCVY